MLYFRAFLDREEYELNFLIRVHNHNVVSNTKCLVSVDVCLFVFFCRTCQSLVPEASWGLQSSHDGIISHVSKVRSPL